MKLIKALLGSVVLLALIACGGSASDADSVPDANDFPEYTGSGFITQGVAETTTDNLIDCGRVAGLGVIEDAFENIWVVPAEVNYDDSNFPFASELNNPCSGANYSSADEALASVSESDIVEIDSDGELITAYIFADNYFEMYVNGVPVGKDRVPFTEFNSDFVRFKVNKPFTVAMKLVDWEENLGLGSEDNRGFDYQPGDGGMVAVFKDELGDIIEITDESWKAQTFYTAPIKDLTCLAESGTTRLSSSCNEDGTEDGSSYFAIHWFVPSNWAEEDYDDSDWPSATTYTNEIIGVDNKSAYTNFTDIFDDTINDALFIWSTNVVLDNEVIVRKIIQ